MKSELFDYVVIGSGLAGLTFALHAATHGKVCVVTKARLAESNTTYAQGGIAAAIGESDSWQLHERDTLIAGAGLCDEAAVRHLVQQAPAAIEWLQSIGAQFDLNSLQDLELGREGGHSRHRIVHHADRTGWEVERAVSEAVKQNPNITIYEHAFVTQLLIAQGRCIGAAATINDLGQRMILGRATMLATGGCGRIYSHTTNPAIATSDGIGLGLEAGAKVEDMEFMQFHPTTLLHPHLTGFLITEAVRGEGGTLRNHRGKRFMFDYDERLELAPRDIVARSIVREMARLDTWCVYLDTTHMDSEHLQRAFPTIWERLSGIGLKIDRDWIPVVPAQHYSCGGVKTNLQGQTNVPGLYASGEVASTGVHGANRLASNSLLEAMVFSVSAAEACRTEPTVQISGIEVKDVKCIRESDAIRLRHSLQRVMSQHVGVFRTDSGLNQARDAVAELKAEYLSLPEAPFTPYSREAWSMILTAETVVNGALRRRTNVGLHFNEDLAVS